MSEPQEKQKALPVALVASPCIGVCALDMADVCLGCYRHVDEVVAWSSMNNEQRRAVLRISEQRARDAGAFL